MPSTSGVASSALMRRASFSHTASFMSWLPMLATCSPLRLASCLRFGTAAMSCSTPRTPAL
jgi:hypothetical protein